VNKKVGQPILFPQIRGGTSPKKVDKTPVLAKISTGPPKKVGEIIVPLVPVPPGKVPKPLIFNHLGPEQCGTMWNNDCSGPN
jgi:hypothetical protein